MHSAPDSGAFRSVGEVVRADWPRLLLEVIVLVLGISISFALDEWRTEREAQQAERRVWQAVRDDLAADTLYLTRRLVQLRGMVAGYRRLLAEQPDSVAADMDKLMSYVAFRPTDVALEEIRQGSGTRLRERALVGRLVSLHAREYDLVREWDAINRDFVLGRLYPYLDTNSPSSADLDATWRALRAQPSFRNLVHTHLTFKDAQLAVYDRALAAARELTKGVAPAAR